MSESVKPQSGKAFSVAILGAGAGGLAMAISLQKAGIPFTIYEKAASVGGTWRDNRYPGCACDVQSHLYSFSFEPNPEWTRMFAPQPEIRAYLEHCTDKYALRPHIRLNQNVTQARWDEDARLWRVRTEAGDTYAGRILVSGMGLIPKEYYEAGEGFGANGWQRFWRITLPLLRPSLQSALILRTLAAFEVFAVVTALGGTTLPVLMGETFNWQFAMQDRNVASAYALVILGISIAATLFFLRVLRVPKGATI